VSEPAKERAMAESELPVFPFDTPPELDVDPRHAVLRQEDPVAAVRLAPGGVVRLVTRYEDVKRVYADPVFSRAEATRPGTPALRPVRQNPVPVARLPGLRPTEPETVDWKQGMITRAPVALPVVW
jgi:hypothetical protein